MGWIFWYNDDFLIFFGRGKGLGLLPRKRKTNRTSRFSPFPLLKTLLRRRLLDRLVRPPVFRGPSCQCQVQKGVFFRCVLPSRLHESDVNRGHRHHQNFPSPTQPILPRPRHRYRSRQLLLHRARRDPIPSQTCPPEPFASRLPPSLMLAIPFPRFCCAIRGIRDFSDPSQQIAVDLECISPKPSDRDKPRTAKRHPLLDAFDWEVVVGDTSC